MFKKIYYWWKNRETIRGLRKALLCLYPWWKKPFIWIRSVVRSCISYIQIRRCKNVKELREYLIKKGCIPK